MFEQSTRSRSKRFVRLAREYAAQSTFWRVSPAVFLQRDLARGENPRGACRRREARAGPERHVQPPGCVRRVHQWILRVNGELLQQCASSGRQKRS